MKSAVIIGASSGIGRALAGALSHAGYQVGLVARRGNLLAELRQELPGHSVVKVVDVSDVERAMSSVRELINELGDVELFVLSAGTGAENPGLAWEPEKCTIAVNVLGFAAMVNVAVAHLEKRRSGHLVGISSLAALRGFGGAPAYFASKAFVSNYLEGVRHRFRKLRIPVFVTDVKPGLVDTRLAGGDFWMASPETAARQIARAIRKRRSRVYVTKRWLLVAWLMRLAPDSVWGRL